MNSYLGWVNKNPMAKPVFNRILQSPYPVWLLLSVPAWPLIADIGVNERYYAEIMWESGVWSVQFLVLALAISPLTRLFSDWTAFRTPSRWLLKQRRAIGVASFGYALLHTLFYVRYTGSLDLILLEATDLFLAFGWAGFLILAVLASTSNRVSVRALATRWKPLQRFAYLAAAFTALHWLWADQFLETLYWWVAITAILQILRVIRNWQTTKRPARPALQQE